MNYDQIIVLNTLKLNYKELSITDSKGFVNMKSGDYQLPTNFYGNRVVNLAKTAYPGIYLCVDRRNNVFDILVKKDEIAELEPAEIRAILEAKRIPFKQNTTKKHLLALLGVEYTGAEPDPSLVATGVGGQAPDAGNQGTGNTQNQA